MHLSMYLVYDKHSRKININIKRELLGPWICNVKHPKKKGEGESLRQGDEACSCYCGDKRTFPKVCEKTRVKHLHTQKRPVTKNALSLLHHPI